MEAVKTKKKKSKKKLIVLAVILLVIIGLFASCRAMCTSAQEQMLAAMNAMQTDTVTIRELTKSIGATGRVISVQSKEISAVLSGAEVSEVFVQVGDTVEEGQTLLQFNTEDIEDNLAAAQRALNQTRGQYGISAQNAQRGVEDARRGADYQSQLAYNNMESAWLSYANACDSLDDLEEAEDEAFDAWDDAEDLYDELMDLLDDGKAEEGEESHLVTLSDGTTYNLSDEGLQDVLTWLKVSDATQIAAVHRQFETAVTQTEIAYDQARSARQSMQTNVESLYIVYENAVISYENTVASAGSSVASAQAAQESAVLSQNTDQQQLQIDALTEQLEEGIVTAPFSGIVTAVNYDPGDIYMQGTLVTVQDCSKFEIEAQIGEYDIADIALGQKVIIKTDSTRDQELEGTVVFVAPTATVNTTAAMSGMQSGTSTDPTYEVRISVDTPSDRLRLDMSANLSIIIQKAKNAMTVPYNAVQRAEDGSYFVEVVESDGKTLTPVPVTVVMESNYYTQIKGDLQEGQTVRLVNQQTSDMFSVMADMSAMGAGGF